MTRDRLRDAAIAALVIACVLIWVANFTKFPT